MTPGVDAATSDSSQARLNDLGVVDFESRDKGVELIEGRVKDSDNDLEESLGQSKEYDAGLDKNQPKDGDIPLIQSIEDQELPSHVAKIISGIEIQIIAKLSSQTQEISLKSHSDILFSSHYSPSNLLKPRVSRNGCILFPVTIQLDLRRKRPSFLVLNRLTLTAHVELKGLDSYFTTMSELGADCSTSMRDNDIDYTSNKNTKIQFIESERKIDIMGPMCDIHDFDAINPLAALADGFIPLIKMIYSLKPHR